MSKKKKIVLPQEITEKAQSYLNLWINLNSSSDEKTIDSIRKEMSELWKLMDKGDIRDFHRESDDYERKIKPSKFIK